MLRCKNLSEEYSGVDRAVTNMRKKQFQFLLSIDMPKPGSLHLVVILPVGFSEKET